MSRSPLARGRGGLGFSQLGQTHAAMLFNPRGTLSCRARSECFELILLQVALFSFYKTKAAAVAAETMLKMAANTVRPSLTEDRVAVGLQKGNSDRETLCRGELSVTTRWVC